MSSITAYVTTANSDTLTWKVIVSEPKFHQTDRRVRLQKNGVILVGERNEALSRVISRALAFHNAMMRVQGMHMSKLVHAVYFDQLWRNIKAPPISELLAN
jgi:hypothetical protein